MDTHLERETKFDVAPRFRLPDLVDGSPFRAEHATLKLASTYLDTADLALLRHRVTLRRRVGDTDVGWQLKVPTGDARTEFTAPLDGTDDGTGTATGRELPARLAELLRGLAHGQPLRPVAVIETERQVHRLLLGAELVAEIADDHVLAAALGDEARVSEWREVEIELGSGDERLLTRLGRRLVEAGAAPSDSSSKLARTLDWRVPVPRTEAGRLVADYLGMQLAALAHGDIALRRGFDPVHKTRVGARRFRSVLRVFAEVFDSAETQRLDDELSWYQDLLGEVRDREVQRARLDAAVHALAPELVLGPVAAEIEQTLLTEQLTARDRVMAALDSDRYQQLLAAVTAWALEPPLREGVEIKQLRQRARSARRTALKRLRRGIEHHDAEQLHRARKAAKRARYATELVAPAAGTSAVERVERFEHIQEVLGEHQDSAVAASLLRRLGAAAANGFTYGVLWQREQDAADRARLAARSLRG